MYLLAYLHGSQDLSSVIKLLYLSRCKSNVQKNYGHCANSPMAIAGYVRCAAHPPEINGEKLPQLYLRL